MRKFLSICATVILTSCSFNALRQPGHISNCESSFIERYDSLITETKHKTIQKDRALRSVFYVYDAAPPGLNKEASCLIHNEANVNTDEELLISFYSNRTRAMIQLWFNFKQDMAKVYIFGSAQSTLYEDLYIVDTGIMVSATNGIKELAKSNIIEKSPFFFTGKDYIDGETYKKILLDITNEQVASHLN